MRKIIGTLILFLMILMLSTGNLYIAGLEDLVAFALVLLLGLWLLFGKSGKGQQHKAAPPRPAPPPAPPKPAEPTVAVCPDCGKRYPPTQVYCDECGALLEKK